MSETPNRVLVYADTTGEPVVVGSLVFDAAIRRRAGVSTTFTYDPTWLARPDAYAIDPQLLSSVAPQLSLACLAASRTAPPTGGDATSSRSAFAPSRCVRAPANAPSPTSTISSASQT